MLNFQKLKLKTTVYVTGPLVLNFPLKKLILLDKSSVERIQFLL